MVLARGRILSTGGALLALLPYFVHSYSTQGVSLAYNLTNNVNQYHLSGSGQIVGIKPYFFLEDVVNVDYEGDFFMINFDPYNLFIGNRAALSKDFFLPGVGNRTTLYAKFYNFHAPSYDRYSTSEFTGGDSIRFYAGKVLFLPDVHVRYRLYNADLMTSYLEPRVKTHVRIPLPYAFLTSGASAGLRMYGEERTPSYAASVELLFPLSLDFSLSADFGFSRALAPDSVFIVPADYADDPFFEEENLELAYDIGLNLNRSLLKDRAFIEVRANAFRKQFFEMNGVGRTDEGVGLSLRYTRYMTRQFVFHLRAGTLLNSSNVENSTFDYIKDDFEMIFELIF